MKVGHPVSEYLSVLGFSVLRPKKQYSKLSNEHSIVYNSILGT